MKCTVTVIMDNAAFAETPGDELARIFRTCADLVSDATADDFADVMLRDANGNQVGHIFFSE